MIQSQTYRRKQKGNVNIDPNDIDTYRYGYALRIMRRSRGRIGKRDAYQLAAIPGFLHWLFRRPIAFFKKQRVRRRIDRKLDKSNKERQKNG